MRLRINGARGNHEGWQAKVLCEGKMSEMSKSPIMVFDVESIGLHGDGFAVGLVVIEGGQEVDSCFYRCQPSSVSGRKESFDWVEANVIPSLDHQIACKFSNGLGICPPREVRDLFWNRWMSWRGNGAILAADCPWPVESRFLRQCVLDDFPDREWLGPYPLIDIASVRFAAGLDPLGTTSRLEDELPVHHPLADARQSARLLLEALKIKAGE